MNKVNRSLYSFIGLVIFQIFMSMEEIIGKFPGSIPVLTGKVHNRIPFSPVIHISEQVFMFMTFIIIIILFVVLAFVFIESRWARVLTVIIGIFEVLNAGLHILTSIYFMKYIAGLISAVGVIIFGLLIIFLKPSFQAEETEETE